MNETAQDLFYAYAIEGAKSSQGNQLSFPCIILCHILDVII